MNINITPSAVAVDTAANLLAFLEMAKDPSKLKAVLDQIKTAQDAAAAEVKAAEAVKAEASAAARQAEAQKAKASSELAALREESAKAAAASADALAVRDAIKEERKRFDDWMAGQREALDAAKARVAADAAANSLFAQELDSRERALEERDEACSRVTAAAEALRAEYQQKIAALKSMI